MEKGFEDYLREYIQRTTKDNRLAYSVASAAIKKYPQMDAQTRIVDVDYAEPRIEIKSHVGLRHVEMSEYIYEQSVERPLEGGHPPVKYRVFIYAGYDLPTNTFYMYIRMED